MSSFLYSRFWLSRVRFSKVQPAGPLSKWASEAMAEDERDTLGNAKLALASLSRNLIVQK